MVPLASTEISIIREVHRNPHMTPSQLAAVTGLHRSNISTAVRTLEAAGLVAWVQTREDARSATLAPTDLAEASIARIITYWVDRLSKAPADRCLMP